MAFDNQPVEIPQTLPMLPVRDIVVFPYMIIPLFVGREASIRSVEDALAKNRLIFLASQKDISEENPSAESIYKVGTVAKIMRMRKLSDGRVKILIQGEAKAEITSFVKTNGCFEVSVEKLSDVVPTQTAPEMEAMIRTAKESIEKMIAFGKALSPDILLVLDDVTDAGRVADLIASNLGVKVAEAQKVLETRNPIERLSLVNQILMAELEVLQAQAKIRGHGRGDDQKNQRENFLREQMKAIKSELGENADSKSEEMDELKNKILSAGMPEAVQIEAMNPIPLDIN